MQQFLDALSQQVLPLVQSGKSRIVAHSPVTSEDFALENVTPDSYIEAYPHDRERHTHYEWMWLLSGEAQMKVNGHVYTLAPGDFCFLPPQVLHADVYDRQTPSYESIWFGHWPGGITSTLFAYQQFGRSKILGRMTVPAPTLITTTVASLQNELENPGLDHAAAHSEAIRHGLLLQLVGQLLRAMEAGQDSDIATSSASAQVLLFLREHYAKNLTLSDIARHTHFSPNYLASRFKQETGQTIFDALTKIRVEHATRLLVEHQMPVNEVAKAVGYNSLDRFSRVFRQLKGVPPSQYGQHSSRA